jgi:hypothetical protein
MWQPTLLQFCFVRVANNLFLKHIQHVINKNSRPIEDGCKSIIKN